MSEALRRRRGQLPPLAGQPRDQRRLAPALSVPCGFSETGLPIGLQLIGRALDEATLLRAAFANEQATPWHQRHPVLPA